MSPSPEDRVSGSDALEFEPVEAKKLKKSSTGRWFAALIVIGIGGAGGYYFFSDQINFTKQRTIPVIRAEMTPIKIQPADPGGMNIPDRDKLVYERLNGETGETTVERLLPPPEEPMEIPEIASLPKIIEETVPQTLQEAAIAETAEADPISLEPLEPMAIPEAVIVAEAPLAPAPPPAPVEEVTSTVIEPTVSEPVEDVQVTAVTVPEPTPVVSSSGVILEEKAAGYRVQIAALRSQASAEKEWKRLKKAHSDLLGDKQLFIMRIDLGAESGIFYRLRVGPLANAADAKSLCGKLTAKKVGCLVIKPGK